MRVSGASLADPAAYAGGVPHEEFARLRREQPVAWVPEVPLVRHHDDGAAAVSQGTGFWAVTAYAGVVAASREPGVFSSAARGVFLADPARPEDLERNRQLLVNMDAPQHTAMRRLLAGSFTPRAIGELRVAVNRHARAVVDRAVALGEVDAVTDLAAELPLLVLADLLGMPREDRGLLFGWSNNLVGFDDPRYGGGSVRAYRQTFVEALGYAGEMVAQRRRSPREDLLTQLVHAEAGGRRMTDEELCQLWLLLVIAGNETTRHLVSGTIVALLDHPDQRLLIAAEPQLIPRAVEELLRWVTPIMQFRRTAVRDVVLDGQPISAGDKVVLYYVSANRDEAVFTAPDVLDLARVDNPHLAFGIGPHFCLGAHLARLEAVELLAALHPYLPDLRQAGPAERMRSNFMNAVTALPIRLRR